jgi:hypothetical protein
MPIKVEAKQVYKVFELRTTADDFEEVEVAKVDGQKVTGPRANDIRKLLTEQGWPKRSPSEVLCGNYLWAERFIGAAAGK